MKYKLVVDCGKPFEEILTSKEELFNRLNELETRDKEHCPYFDVVIYDMDDKDITEEMYKEFKIIMMEVE